jgi:hypothetical protein
MSEPLATYSYQWDDPPQWRGWWWELRLFPDRLVSHGTDGQSEEDWVHPLAGVEAAPNRFRSPYRAERNELALALTAAVAAVVAVLFWPAIADDEVPLKLKCILAFAGLLGTFGILAQVVAVRRWSTKSSFVQRDGTEAFVVWSPDARYDAEAAEFVAQVSRAIAALDRGQT